MAYINYFFIFIFNRAYDKLGVEHKPLSLIEPEFETPLPRLRPAVIYSNLVFFLFFIIYSIKWHNMFALIEIILIQLYRKKETYIDEMTQSVALWRGSGFWPHKYTAISICSNICIIDFC